MTDRLSAGRPRNDSVEGDRLAVAIAKGKLVPSYMFGADGDIRPEYREDVAAIRRSEDRKTDRILLIKIAESRQ